ncbi:MAG: hypothetical protein FWD31_08880 [Planctomycetaceae bacterium]|nr:hypothetical protein [Planctomycetaceae bacterium]
MGVDFLDIMYRVERSLGIRIEPEDFNFITESGKLLVGEFYDVVERKVSKAALETINSPDYWEKTLNDVKQAFSEGLGLPKSENWTKETSLRELYEQIPENERRKTWRNFTKHGNGPVVQKTNWAIFAKFKHLPVWIGFSGCLILALICPLVMTGYYFYSKTWLLTIFDEWIFGLLVFFLGGIFWLLIFCGINIRCRVNFLPEMTLGEIVDFIVLYEKKSLKEDGSPYTREEIERIVKAALCDALAVKPEDVTPEADIIRDLGMG